MRLIDKDALIDAVEGAINVLELHGVSRIFTSVPLAIIKGVPAIDAAPVVHGRWTRSDDNSSVSCSECHMPLAKTRVKYADIGYEGYCFIQTKYCPHCGAKMDGDPGPIRISHGELVQMEREAET